MATLEERARRRRVLWGRLIRVFLRAGWNPPRPSDRVAHAILDDMAGLERPGAQHADREAALERKRTLISAHATLELSPAETRALALASDGWTYEEAARLAGVSTETMKKQIKQALRRLGARNTTHAVALAIRKGRLEPPGSY